MSPALRVENGRQQFVISKDAVHFAHPRLPQFRYFLVQKTFP